MYLVVATGPGEPEPRVLVTGGDVVDVIVSDTDVTTKSTTLSRPAVDRVELHPFEAWRRAWHDDERGRRATLECSVPVAVEGSVDALERTRPNLCR
jgi:hypothetical protein